MVHAIVEPVLVATHLHTIGLVDARFGQCIVFLL